MTEDRCRIYEVDGEAVPVLGGEPLGAAGQAVFAEIDSWRPSRAAREALTSGGWSA